MNRSMRMKSVKLAALNNAVYIFGLLMIITFSILSEHFFTATNGTAILRNSTLMLSIGIGLTFALIVGELDLSVGANCRFAASVSALLMVNYGWNPYLCLLLMPILGGIVGLVNGWLVTRVKLNAWLVTLSMKLVLVGIVVKLTNTVAINMPEEVLNFRNIKIFGLSSFIVFILVVMLIMQVILKFTAFGRKLVAVGSNPLAAEKLGISIKNYKLAAFVISGFFAGLGGMLISINLGSITRELGDGYEFTAVSAVVLGGVSLVGGEGNVFPKAFAGVLILTMIENGLTMIGADIYMFQIAKALIIFLMMYIDSIKNKM